MNFRSILFAIATLAAASQASAATVYTCSMKEAGNSGWIAPKLQIVHTPGEKSARITDVVTHRFNKEKPVTARVDAENAKRVTFVWRLQLRDKNGQNGRMQYRATWVKSDKRMNVVAVPLGYTNRFQGYGNCKVTQR